MSRCLGIPNTDNEETAYASSPVFSEGTTQVSSQAVVYSSLAAVQSDLRAAHLPQLSSCLARLIADTGATHVRITKIALPSTAGASSGFRVTGSFDQPTSAGGGHLTIDEVRLAKSRVEVYLNAATSGTTLPVGLIDRATAALAQRLDNNTT